MNIETLIESLNHDTYEALKRALELSKWPDGTRLDKEQKALCMEAILRFERTHGVPEHERVGYMEQACKSSSKNDDGTQPITLH